MDHRPVSANVDPRWLLNSNACHDLKRETEDDEVPCLEHDSQYEREDRSRDRLVYESDGDGFTSKDDTQGVQGSIDGPTDMVHSLDTVRTVVRGSYRVLSLERKLKYLGISGSAAFSKEELRVFAIEIHAATEPVKLPTYKTVRTSSGSI